MTQAELDAWSRGNAVAMLLSASLSLALSELWPVSALGLISALVLLARSRRRWTPAGHLGLANWVTSFRMFAVVAIGVLPGGLSGRVLAAMVLCLFALDGVDGWLARHARTASDFGARFDLETDALFVLVVTLLLFQRRWLGPWVLVPGLLRYVYVLSLALIPPRNRDVPRTKLGRYAFAILIFGLALALALRDRIGVAFAAIGCAAVTLSFARSFYWAYSREATRPSELASEAPASGP